MDTLININNLSNEPTARSRNKQSTNNIKTIKIMRLEFKSVKEMVNWLIDNEEKHLYDMYGRRWMYSINSFYFKDIGADSIFIDGLFCTHLYGTELGTP